MVQELQIEERAVFPVTQEKGGHDGHDAQGGAHAAMHTMHRFINWFSGVSAAVSLAPFVLSALDAGKIKEVRQIVDYNGACCSIIAAKKPFGKDGNYSFSRIAPGQAFQGLDGEHRGIQGNTYGIAGMLSHLLLKMPKVGYHLGTGTLPEPLNEKLRQIPRIGNYAAEMKMANALAAGGIILLGELSGSALEKWQKRHARKQAEKEGRNPEEAAARAGAAGSAVSLAGQGMGLFIALPTILAGVGHAIEVTTATFGIDKISDISKPEGIGGHIMAFLGKPMGECGGQYKAPTGAATAGLVGLCCAVPAALSAVSLLASRHRNHPENEATTMDKPYSELSVIHDDLGEVVNHHHAIPWDRFEREAEEVTRRMEALEKQVERREKVAKAAKWGIRAVAVAGAVAGGAWLKRRAPQVAEGASLPDTDAAQEAMTRFEQAGKTPGAPMMQTNRAEGADKPALLGEMGTEDKTTAFREQVDKLPPVVKFKHVKPESMGGDSGTVPGCCVNDKSGCCGTPYYKGDVARGLYAALSDLVKQVGQPLATGGKKQGALVFGSVAAVSAGVFFEVANKVERRMVEKPRQALEELRTRHNVLQGVIGHMEREVLNKGQSGGHGGHTM